MKISFQNQDLIKNFDKMSVNTDIPKAAKGEPCSMGSSPVKLDLGNSKAEKQNNFFSADEKKSGKTLTELMQEAGNIDASVSQDYRTVMSNTMSSEDYARASEEGFDYYKMDPDEVVTIQDRIKAEVAKGGEVIIGYNDSLSDSVLAEALGSETLAREIESSFSEADLPLTEENIDGIKKAWELASDLKMPTDSEIAYMVENELEPDIWGLYLAQNSGNIQGKELSEERVDLLDESNAKLLKQVEDILDNAGYTETVDREEGIRNAQWLLDRELPINPENIKKVDDAASLAFPIEEDIFSKAVASAVAEGKKPMQAYPVRSEDRPISDHRKAAELESFIFSDEAVSVIQDRRALEEIRLSMTAEVNIKLIGSGISIDTAPIEEFIDALKEAEKQVAHRYFPEYKDDGDKAVSSYRLFNEADKAVREIKDDPIGALGMFVSGPVKDIKDITVGEFHKEGVRLKDTYEKAGESYEALMTAPRADLGDSIKKAFANAPVLADEIGIEKSEDNLRAIRILGYNQMEISPQNVQSVSEADREVRNVIQKMTPASVLGMIRDGINPLETSFAELNTYFDVSQTGGYEETAKSYSEFLYGLEMQDNITPEERESYIGIYRLIHQIEKADGAAIGAVLNEQAVLSFENLLSAARTRRLHGVDVRVDESFGARSELLRAGTDITQQIAAAFKQERYVTEAQELRNVVNTGKEAASLLQDYGIPGSAENLIAIDSLIEKESNLFDEMRRYDKDGRLKKSAERLREALSSDSFEEEYDEASKELEELSGEMILSAESYIDIKALSLVHRQLSLVRRINEVTDPLSDRDFIIPMQFGEEISKVRISFRNEGAGARVTISTAIGGEELEGFFELSEGNLEGYITETGRGALKNPEGFADIIVETLRKEPLLAGTKIGNIPVINSDSKGKRAVSNSKDNSRSKDAEAIGSDGTERRILLQVTRIFLQSVPV